MSLRDIPGFSAKAGAAPIARNVFAAVTDRLSQLYYADVEAARSRDAE
ncbi:MAG: hypothetical protein IIB27_05620 [Chloroflexi bacterium]|nr:hypothetical protein [Chloroflexota bacterium]